MARNINRDLSRVYFDPSNPGSYGGKEKLYRQVKDLGYSREDIEDWLTSQDVYTVYHKLTRNFERPRVVVPIENYQWDLDTCNMTAYSPENKKFSYFLVAIDIFTRYAYTVPLLTLTSGEVIEALRGIFEKSKPQRCRTDMGSEFCSKEAEQFFKDESIIHFTSKTETKANFAERLIRTLKTMITRHMYQYQDEKWLHVLEEITDNYNHSFHTSIRMSPIQAQTSDPFTVWNNQYGKIRKFIKQPKTMQIIDEDFKFEIGDKVRIAKFKKAFERAYDQKFSDEIFTVTSREKRQGIPVYFLESWDKDPVIGLFYENELQKVRIDKSTVYKVEKILKQQTKNKKRGYLVKWLGWPDKYNSFVTTKQMKRINKYKSSRRK